MKEKDFILVFVPRSLEARLKDSPKIEFKGRTLFRDKIYHLAGQILRRYFMAKSAVMNISAEINREWYGTYYNFYMDYLISIGMIEKLKNHIAGQKCTTYKLIDTISADDTARIENHNTALIKKWVKQYLTGAVRKYSESRIDAAVMSRMICDLYTFHVHKPGATAYLEMQRKNGNISLNKFVCNMCSVEYIAVQQMYHQEDKYGRFHTNFTSLKKQVRNNFLTCNGEQVEETDIVNSQPFFLAVHLKRMGFHLQHPDEYQRFHSIVCAGTIYEQLGEALETNRDDAKSKMYTVLFGETKNIKAHTVFRKLYPAIWQYIADVKIKHKMYEWLSHELQRMESDLIFNKICKRVYAELPRICIFTVHDSLFYQAEYKKQVDAIFNEELAKL